MKKIMLLVIWLVLCVACKHDVIRPKKINSYLAAPTTPYRCEVSGTISYKLNVKPIVERNCYSCHDNSCSITFTQFEELRYYAGSGKLIESLKEHRTTSNEPLEECSIELIKAWVKQGSQNN